MEFRHGGGSQNPAKVVAFVALWVLLAEASLSSTKALAGRPKKGYAFENLMKFYSAQPVMTHWLPRRRLELNPKSSNSTAAARGGSGSQGCSAGCGCNDCMTSRH